MFQFLFLFFTPLLLLAKDGQTIYMETCAACHGEKGRAESKIQLVVKPRVLHKSILTQKQMFKIIKHGAHHFGARSDIMPAFKYIYSDAEIQSVAKYISNTFNPNIKSKIKKLLRYSQVTPTKSIEERLSIGGKIFQKRCAKCHGVKGNGESKYVEMSKSNVKFIYPYNLKKTLLTEDQILLFAKYGSKYWGADKNDMPAWFIKYDDCELRFVAKYIQKNIKN